MLHSGESRKKVYLKNRIANLHTHEIMLIHSYSIDGLSAAGLRVILQPLNKDGKPDGFSRLLWATKDPTNKAWTEAQTLYTFNRDHLVR